MNNCERGKKQIKLRIENISLNIESLQLKHAV